MGGYKDALFSGGEKWTPLQSCQPSCPYTMLFDAFSQIFPMHLKLRGIPIFLHLVNRTKMCDNSDVEEKFILL